MKDLIGKTTLPVRIGILLAVMSIMFGFSVGIVFGGFDTILRNVLKAKAEAVLVTVYNNDIDKMRSILNMSGGLIKMAHIHANGLGISSLALIFMMILFCPDGKAKDSASVCLGLGALGYSTFWLFAGLKAPGLGSTQLAHDSLHLLAIPAAAMSVAGLLLTFGLFVRAAFIKKKE